MQIAFRITGLSNRDTTREEQDHFAKIIAAKLRCPKKAFTQAPAQTWCVSYRTKNAWMIYWWLFLKLILFREQLTRMK